MQMDFRVLASLSCGSESDMRSPSTPTGMDSASGRADRTGEEGEDAGEEEWAASTGRARLT